MVGDVQSVVAAGTKQIPLGNTKSVYHKQCRHCGNDLDVYDVLDMFEVESHAIGHAIKKLLMAGKRIGGKDYKQDLREAIASIERGLQSEPRKKKRKQ